MKKNRRMVFESLVLVCFFAGVICAVTACAPVHHYNRLQVAAFVSLPRKPYHTVKVFQTPDDVKRPYEVIGMMSCEGSAGEEAGILNAMLYRAADMGADAIILNVPRVSAESVNSNKNKVDVNLKENIWAAMTGQGDQRAYRAQTIIFNEQALPNEKFTSAVPIVPAGFRSNCGVLCWLLTL